MTMLRLPYVQAFRDRHGKLRHYFRKGGQKRVPLPGSPGSPEFMAAYQDAISSKDESPPPNVKPGTISALGIAYLNSPDFKRLAASTRDNHRSILERFREQYGDRSVAALTRRHVEALIHQTSDRPAKANHLLNVIRRMMRLGVKLGLRTSDPTEGIKKVRYREAPIHTWSPEQIEQFIRHWPLGTRAHLACALLLFTAQRKSDVVRMGPIHMVGGRLNLTQIKTGAQIRIPLHRNLKSALSAGPTGKTTFLETAYGKPMTVAGFSNWFRNCVADAGLPKQCSPHGLRKAACVKLAELGCSAHEIMAISGHRTLSEVERYTSAYNQGRVADRTMEKWERDTKIKR